MGWLFSDWLNWCWSRFFFHHDWSWIIELRPDLVSSFIECHCRNIDNWRWFISNWLFYWSNFFSFLRCSFALLNRHFHEHWLFFFSHWCWVIELRPNLICGFIKCHSWGINLNDLDWLFRSRFCFSRSWHFFNNFFNNNFFHDLFFW